MADTGHTRGRGPRRGNSRSTDPAPTDRRKADQSPQDEENTALIQSLPIRNSDQEQIPGLTKASESRGSLPQQPQQQLPPETAANKLGRRLALTDSLLDSSKCGDGSGGRCASCPGSRTGSRSNSRTRHRNASGYRRTSGILYKLIPPKPVMGAGVFQAARKSEEEIEAIQRKPQVKEYYRSMNELLDSFAEVEEILKEHREEELASAKLFPQLPYPRSEQSLSQSQQNPGSFGPVGSPGYGAVTCNGSNETVREAITNYHLSATHYYARDNEDDQPDLESGEEMPLMESRRKKKTSPHLVQLAINMSFIVNVFLVVIKIWTVLMSDSLAVLASMIDSLMDLLSGAIIWYSARLRDNTADGHHYPVGKARMEPLGIIVFAAVMVTSFMQVMLQSFERLLAGSEEPPVDLELRILLLIGISILVKFLLWLWCRTIKDSSSVQALAQDHLNDVVFNIFSTLFPVAGKHLSLWWLDAAGAIILSIYIITEWVSTCLHNIRRLTGQAATAADIQQLTYMAYRFSNTIQAIDTVRAYYAGDGLFVEVDIVLPPDTPLSQAHDLGESLQSALERLDNVERAFVHIDYNAVHAIEHRQHVPLSQQVLQQQQQQQLLLQHSNDRPVPPQHQA